MFLRFSQETLQQSKFRHLKLFQIKFEIYLNCTEQLPPGKVCKQTSCIDISTFNILFE